MVNILTNSIYTQQPLQTIRPNIQYLVRLWKLCAFPRSTCLTPKWEKSAFVSCVKSVLPIRSAMKSWVSLDSKASKTLRQNYTTSSNTVVEMLQMLGTNVSLPPKVAEVLVISNSSNQIQWILLPQPNKTQSAIIKCSDLYWFNSNSQIKKTLLCNATVDCTHCKLLQQLWCQYHPAILC